MFQRFVRVIGAIGAVWMIGCVRVRADAGAAEPAAYDLDVWRSANEVTLSRVRQIFQTPDGYIWFSTVAGAVRFDGVNFTTFDLKSGALGDNEIWAMREATDGTIWIGTVGGGITRYRDGVFKRFTHADGLADDVIRQIDIDASGALWIGTLRGVSRFANGVFTNFTVKDGLASDTVPAISASSAEGVFTVSGGRVQKLEGARFVSADADWPNRRSRALSLRSGRDGALWVTYENGQVNRFAHGVATAIPVEDSTDARDSFVYSDSHGTVWMGARDGLRRLTEGTFRRYQPPGVSTPLRGILGMGEDREGGLWFGFESSGLGRLEAAHFRTISVEEGLAERATRAVFQDHRGDIWIGTASGPARYRDGKVTNFPTVNGVPIPVVTGFGEDAAGTLWFAAGGMILQVHDDTVAPMPGWKPSADIKGFYRDRENRMWVTTDGDGLYVFDQGRWTRFRTRDGLPSNSVRGIIETKDGSIWITTFGGGISRYVDGKFTNYSTQQGLGSNRVVALRELPDGSLWFGTRGGITRWQNGRFRNFDVDDGLPVNFVSAIIDDGAGQLWFTSDRGIFRVAIDDFEAVATGRRPRVTAVTYGAADGLRTTAFMAGHEPSSWRTPEGLLLFPSLDGLVIVDPKTRMSNHVVPPVHIERVTINRSPISLDGTADIAPGRGDVQIDYTALCFTAPDRVRFRYQLEGFDSEWVDANTRRFAYYGSLPPGKYTFRVIACNNDGVWNNTGATISFRLRPHFYDTLWFYALCGVFVIGSVCGFYVLRLRQAEAHKARLQREVAEAVANMKLLRGMLPICASCKRVREDSGYWQQIETYIRDHSDTEFTHGLCPECIRRLYPVGVDAAAPEPSADRATENPEPPAELDLR